MEKVNFAGAAKLKLFQPDEGNVVNSKVGGESGDVMSVVNFHLNLNLLSWHAVLVLQLKLCAKNVISALFLSKLKWFEFPDAYSSQLMKSIICDTKHTSISLVLVEVNW